MSYMHIDNLYKDQSIFMFRECYAMEKIHGTSAHVSWTIQVGGEDNPPSENLTFFSGGADWAVFQALFDQEALRTKLKESGIRNITFFGEAYGGKMQGMSATYGPILRFVVFEVKIGESWLNVAKAEELAHQFGFDFVPYERVPATLEALDAEMKKPSVQGKKNGVVEEHLREGIVVRPLQEMQSNGGRIIVKHKNEQFKETKSPRPVDNDKLKVLEDAKAISDEWVTEMRLTHVLDGLGLHEPYEMKDTGNVVRAMIEDVIREANGEIVMSVEAKKAIGTAAARIFKQRLTSIQK